MSKKTQKKSLLKRVGPLPVLIGFMFFSFAFRVTDTVEQGKTLFSDDTVSFAQASAQDEDAAPPAAKPSEQQAEKEAEKTAEGEEGALAPIPAQDPVVDDIFDTPPEMADRNFMEESDFSSSEVEILQSLVKRREELRQKERLLNQREALLAAAEKQIESKMVELGTLRGEIETLLGKQQEEQQARIKSLVKMYETMKPKDAARIFDTLEEDVLLSVISQMSERKAAPILASMEAERARVVTIKLAEQKKLPSLPQE